MKENLREDFDQVMYFVEVKMTKKPNKNKIRMLSDE